MDKKTRLSLIYSGYCLCELITLSLRRPFGLGFSIKIVTLVFRRFDISITCYLKLKFFTTIQEYLVSWSQIWYFDYCEFLVGLTEHIKFTRLHLFFVQISILLPKDWSCNLQVFYLYSLLVSITAERVYSKFTVHHYSVPPKAPWLLHRYRGFYSLKTKINSILISAYF